MNALRFFLLSVVLCLSSVIMFAQQGDWTIDYIPDEFGDPTSEKVITHYWDGIRDGGNSCVLGMRVAIRFGMQFALIYNYAKEDLTGLSVSAKFNNQRIPLEIESIENDYLFYTRVRTKNI